MNRTCLPFATALVCALFFAMPRSFGQLERTFYQSYEIDSVRRVNLDIPQEFELYAWAGNTVLIETHILLYEASKAVLDYFIKEKRYQIDMVRGTEEATLAPALPDRKPIKTARGECTEVATVKIFVPDTFEWAIEDKRHLTLKPSN